MWDLVLCKRERGKKKWGSKGKKRESSNGYKKMR